MRCVEGSRYRPHTAPPSWDHSDIPEEDDDSHSHIKASNGKIAVLSQSQTVFTGPPEKSDRFSQAMDVLQEHLGAAAAQRDLRLMAVFIAGTAMVHEVEREEGGGGGRVE